MSHPDDRLIDDDAHLASLFAQLPRETNLPPVEESRIAMALRDRGLLRSRSDAQRFLPLLAAGLVMFAVGVGVGNHVARRNSLDELLERHDLSVSDRVLLLQRAGSAYVRAAHQYSAATATSDSTAVEVAQQVFIGAAEAVARSNLGGPVSKRLAEVIRTSTVHSAPERPQPVMWF